jgi:nucleoside-diphosphate-sugar epimerase
MKIAVTGATGFLGRHLVRELQLAGHAVVAVVRDPRRANDLGVDVVAADLLDVDALTDAFSSCDAVIANAALAPGWSRPDDEAFRDTNVLGARNCLEATVRRGIRRVVWVSTVAVYRTSITRALDERAAQLDPDGTGFDWNHLTTDARYARSKAAAERLAWRHADQHVLALTALRPGPIYGPGDPKLTARYARMLGWPVALAPTVRLPHVHAADVALAAVGAVANPNSAGKAYNVTGPSVSPFHFLRCWRDAQGGRAVVLPIPVPVRVAFDDSAAQRDLGFRPRTVADAVRQMPLPG